jgi:hypothetical protein
MRLQFCAQLHSVLSIGGLTNHLKAFPLKHGLDRLSEDGVIIGEKYS